MSLFMYFAHISICHPNCNCYLKICFKNVVLNLKPEIHGHYSYITVFYSLYLLHFTLYITQLLLWGPKYNSFIYSLLLSSTSSLFPFNSCHLYLFQCYCSSPSHTHIHITIQFLISTTTVSLYKLLSFITVLVFFIG